MGNAIQMYFKLPVDIREEQGRFIASCFLLDTLFEAPNKHDALEALTSAAQSYMTTCSRERAFDAVLHRHDLRVPDDGDELTTGRYVDVTVQLKLPALNRN